MVMISAIATLASPMRRKLAGAGSAAAIAVACLYACDASADEPRVRGGFSIAGGYFGARSDNSDTNGATISLAGRLGVQITNVFSLYYQNTPLGWIVFQGGASPGASDYNSILVDFTIEDVVGLGIGPSVDLFTAGPLGGRGTGVEPGAHARIALLLGGGGGFDRRQAFTIGIDPHVSYYAGGVLVSATAGIGAEWY
jgi:hypothetical protein